MIVANGIVMTAEQLRTAAVVLGVLTAILFVLGQSQLGVVAAILAGGAYTLADRRPSGREDDKP